MTKYTNAKCWQCDMEISVPTHDLADRNYCQSCVLTKLGVYDYRTLLTEGTDD